MLATFIVFATLIVLIQNLPAVVSLRLSKFSTFSTIDASRITASSRIFGSRLYMTDDNKSNDASTEKNSADSDEAEDTVKKYGLEAGLLKAATSKDNKLKPKDLLAKYGIAYLVTSITLAIFSYGFFYFLVSNGVDVASLLEKVGISSTAAATSTGTAAIAYALHKAASPIRFPPTVLLTPVVANVLGKKPKDSSDNNQK